MSTNASDVEKAAHTSSKPGSISNSDSDAAKAETEQTPSLEAGKVQHEDGHQQPGEMLPQGIRLYLIMTGLFMSVFLAALDQTIIAPAIPAISNDFGTTADVAWYLSAYFITSSALLPLYGRLYRFDLKWVFLSCIAIFELGSLICAVAQNSSTFIVGRAIAGWGVAGAYLGVMTIIAASVPLNRKAFWSGNVGAAYGLGAVAGPLIGGAFTTQVTWRWCFWINLPIGGFTIATVILFFQPPARPPLSRNQIFKSIAFDIDWVGTGLLLGAICCILLALQDGGIKRSWSDSESIGLIIGFIVIMIAFGIWQVYLGDRGLMPPRIFTQRTIFFACMVNIAIGASYFTVLSFLPIYFQIRGSSALRSGVQMLPIIAGVVFSVVLTGGLAPKVGYVHPFLLFGLPLMAIMAGVLSLMTVDSSQAFWAGASFAYGVGSGSSWQFPFISAQTTVGKPFTPLDMEQGASLTLFCQTFGGSIFVAVAQSIFQNKFHDGVASISGLMNAEMIASAGETAFRFLAPPEFLPAIEQIAVEAVKSPFYVAAAAAAAGVPFILGIEWNSLSMADIQMGG